MGMILPLCGRAYPVLMIYSDIQTPYVQVEDDPYLNIAPSYDYYWLSLLYQVDN